MSHTYLEAPTDIDADDYFWLMAGRGRLLAIWELGLLCTYFVLGELKEVPRYYHRPCWSTPADVPSGPVIYIDKLKGERFGRDTFRQLERVITGQVPTWRIATWYRPMSTGPERQFIYHRKGGVLHGADL